MDAACPRSRPRLAAPAAWLVAQSHPALDRRRRLVGTCRAELVWARADWLEARGTAEGWQEACLPHEQAAARLIELWGHLHPLEDRLRRAIERLRARRDAGWPWQSTLADLRRYRSERRALWPAFLAAAAAYRSARADASSKADRVAADGQGDRVTWRPSTPHAMPRAS